MPNLGTIKQTIALRRLLHSSSVSFDLALFQDSNGFSVEDTLEPLSLPTDLVKPLEFHEPSLDLDQFLESENSLLPLPLKLPLLLFYFLKLGVNAAPFSFLYVMLELFVPREEVERHKEFLLFRSIILQSNNR